MMKTRRLISWLGKKRLFTLRHAVFYCIVLCFFFSFHYWNEEAFTSTENKSANYLDGESSYFYLRDSDLKSDTDQVSGSDVSIQSAYYDNRASEGERSLVRIFANVYSPTNSAFCCFQVGGYRTWICSKYLAKQKVLSSSDFSGHSSGWHRVAQVMFTCAVDERALGGVRLERITLVSVRNEVARKLSMSHAISYATDSRLRLAKSTSFTVCVLPDTRTPSSRRSSTSQDLFEYFELLKLLGTNEIISYDEDDDVTTVLRKVKGITQETVRGRTNATSSLTLVINDCLYRSLASADYVLFLDVNEVLIPNATRDWSAMLTSLQRVHNTSKVGAYVLQVFDFFDETTNNTSSDTATSNFEPRTANKRTITHLKHLPRVVRFRARDRKTAQEKTILGQPTKIDHITGSGSIKMLPGYINVNVPVDYASVHRFIHDRHVYKGLTIDATKDKFVPLLMRRLYSLGNIVH